MRLSLDYTYKLLIKKGNKDYNEYIVIARDYVLRPTVVIGYTRTSSTTGDTRLTYSSEYYKY